MIRHENDQTRCVRELQRKETEGIKEWGKVRNGREMKDKQKQYNMPLTSTKLYINSIISCTIVSALQYFHSTEI